LANDPERPAAISDEAGIKPYTGLKLPHCGSVSIRRISQGD